MDVCSLTSARVLLEPKCVFSHCSHSYSASVSGPLSVGGVQAQSASKGNQGDGWMAQGSMNWTWLWLVLLQGRQQGVTGEGADSINKGKFGKGC